MNAPVYVDIDQGIHKVKLKNALNEKRKKLRRFSFSINIANFEAFLRTKKVDLKPLFSEECSFMHLKKKVIIFHVRSNFLKEGIYYTSFKTV